MSARGPRYEAMQSGQAMYQSGKPCARGHESPRETKSGSCIECRREGDRRRYSQNPDKMIAKTHAYYVKHAERIKRNRREKYAADPDAEKNVARIRSAEWRFANPDKVLAQRPLKQAYKKANPHKSAAHVAARRAAKMFRTPKWLTKDHLWMINEAYELAALRARSTGCSWHVDHIVPLQGKDVSGLHVPWNLQVIPWRDNVSKGNKVPADVVSALGNGSTKAGSDKLYEMMHEIRKRARSTNVKDLPPPAKSPLQYLKRRR